MVFSGKHYIYRILQKLSFKLSWNKFREWYQDTKSVNNGPNPNSKVKDTH